MKKTVKLSALLLCVVGLFSGSAVAVDGYKNLKFGMSEKEVTALKICSLKKVKDNSSGIETYACNDLKFGNGHSEAGVYFIDGKFVRIAIMQPFNSATAILNQLIAKYGEPEQKPDMQELQNVYDKTNAKADVYFDNKTVALRLMSFEDNSRQALIMYSVSDYDEQQLKAKGDTISNDL